MILKGSQRSGASALADHLMNDRDNDHIEVLEIDGFMADDLHGALQEAYAISKATQCTQYLFSLSLNPPQDHIATDQEFFDAAQRAGEKLGLSDQPRTLIVHEKEGRRHAHVVWSRIDGENLIAINLPHFKSKLQDVSRDLYLDHGWELPEGLQTHGGKNPLNFTLEEWQQAKRQDIDPREIKQAFRQAWERSDTGQSFKRGLEEKGYFLARGDRRGFVALDVDGNIYSISRWAGIKTNDLKAKLGSLSELESVETTRTLLKGEVVENLRGFIHAVKTKQDKELDPLRVNHRDMTRDHRQERRQLKEQQDKRWQEETRARSNRLNKGLRGVWDRVTGHAKQKIKTNEKEALACSRRDQAQRNELIVAQMKERRDLLKQAQKIKTHHAKDRSILARDVRLSYRHIANSKVFNPTGRNQSHARDHQRSTRGPSLNL